MYKSKLKWFYGLVILPLLLLFFYAWPQPPTEEDKGQKTQTGPVLTVYDGDTVAVLYQGQRRSVRLIGIDAPETAGPYTKNECFGREAAAYLRASLKGQQVGLQTDPAGDDLDQYGRLLRYVYVNGENINARLLETGHARIQYGFAFTKFDEFKELENQARKAGLGLWGKCY